MSLLLPRLVGVIHLAALPGSPKNELPIDAIALGAARDAAALAAAGFDAALVENFGDAPFYPASVPPVTVAAMTVCARAVRESAPELALGVNVLRNDANAALAIAVASGASFVRVNVHVGARVTDQGVVEGRAHETLRARAALRAEHVALFCDVDVKHSASLGARPIADETVELLHRGLADAVLVTGCHTGAPVSAEQLAAVVRAAAPAPVLVASGAAAERVDLVACAHGVIVGSSLRADGRAGGPIDPARAARFAAAFRRL